jgi:hypothetical protein
MQSVPARKRGRWSSESGSLVFEIGKHCIEVLYYKLCNAARLQFSCIGVATGAFMSAPGHQPRMRCPDDCSSDDCRTVEMSCLLQRLCDFRMLGPACSALTFSV